MMKSSIRPFGLVFLLVLSLGGCSTVVGSALDSAARSAGSGIGNAVGSRMGAAAGNALAARMPAMWTPDMTGVYMHYLMSMSFHSGTYTLEGTEYEPGEWTRWRVVDSDEEGEPAIIERAFLARTDEGREWWRMKYISETEEGRDSITVEALFDRESGEVIRMRGKMPGEDEASEMPVEEGTYGYVEPAVLTRESMEGARVGQETVRVPAGSFTTDHIRYGATQSGRLDWWMVDSVPGGLVKYSRSQGGDEADGPDPYNWTVELLQYGTDARSSLGVEY